MRSSDRTFVVGCQRRWRKLPPDALAKLIEQTRRRAGLGKRLSQAERHELDLMRRRLAKLEEAQSCFR